MKTLFIISCLLFTTYAAKETVRDSCDTIYCADGQECVEKRYGEPVCECISECNEPNAPVCASNGNELKTFQSECELNKYACERKESESIVKVADVSCEEDFMQKKVESDKLEHDVKREKPVVCQLESRNTLRTAIMNWLQSNLNVEEDHRSYKGLLFMYFNKYDTDRDGNLDTDEFMNIMGEDAKISKILVKTVSNNPMIQGLCMNELLAVTDDDSDYKLSFDEFYKCFDPSYTPPHKHCTLEGRVYMDGEDVEKGCNTCKCSCGNWVCTHKPCNDEQENSSKSKFFRDTTHV